MKTIQYNTNTDTDNTTPTTTVTNTTNTNTTRPYPPRAPPPPPTPPSPPATAHLIVRVEPHPFSCLRLRQTIQALLGRGHDQSPPRHVRENDDGFKSHSHVVPTGTVGLKRHVFRRRSKRGVGAHPALVAGHLLKRNKTTYVQQYEVEKNEVS